MVKQDGFGHEKGGGGLTNDWITPKWIFDALGKFDLDPCESNAQPWTSAKRGYRLAREEDGLALPWDGSVYCNPPYGKHVSSWAGKCAWHGDAIMLLFARVETLAWWDIWTSAHGVLFLKGRVKFHLPDGSVASGSGTAPSALIAFGQEAAERLRRVKIPGVFVTNWACWDGDDPDEQTKLIIPSSPDQAN